MTQKIICVPRRAVDRRQTVSTLSMIALILESGKSPDSGESIRASRAGLRPSVVMAGALSTFCERSFS